MERFFSFVGGLLLGGLVAGTMALLFAPRPGEETRRYLSERGEELKERASVIGTEMSERAQSLRERVSSPIQGPPSESQSTTH